MNVKQGTRQTDRRRRILDAALALFQQTHSIKKVSLEDIARAARVSPTTIYNRFGTREALIIEVAKLILGNIIVMAREHVHSDLPFPRKFAEIAAGKINIVSKVDSEFLVKLVSQDPAIAPFVEEIVRNEVQPLWLEIIRQGKEQGYIDPALDDAAILIYLDIIRVGLSSRPELTRGWEQNMPLIEKLMHIFFFGLFKKDIDLSEVFKKETK
jgi:AcrR family transcriptional regulator